MTCIIVDDEPLAVKLLESFVARTPQLELKGAYTDSVEAIAALREQPVDLIFLDIQMPDMDGLELAHMLPKETMIIFTTAFKEYAFDSYEVSALDFLLKPIRYQKFLGAAEKALRWFELLDAAANAPQATLTPREDKTSVFVKSEGQLRKVEFSDIRYVEGMKDYVLLHLCSERHPIVTHITMKAVEELLPSGNFMRVHRSYIVALDKIDSIGGTYDISVGDTLIHVSDAYKASFEQYLTQRMLR